MISRCWNGFTLVADVTIRIESDTEVGIPKRFVLGKKMIEASTIILEGCKLVKGEVVSRINQQLSPPCTAKGACMKGVQDSVDKHGDREGNGLTASRSGCDDHGVLLAIFMKRRHERFSNRSVLEFR